MYIMYNFGAGAALRQARCGLFIFHEVHQFRQRYNRLPWQTTPLKAFLRQSKMVQKDPPTCTAALRI